MKTIQKFLQAFLFMAALLLMEEGVGQCSVQPVVKHTCHNYTNGSISLQVQGTAPFQFQWSNGSQEQNLESLPEGNYSVTVTDAKGSRVVRSIKITQYTALQINSLVNGSQVTAQVKGGKAPYIYHWVSLSKSDKKTTSQASVQLSKGSYILVVEDGNGCSESHKFKIN